MPANWHGGFGAEEGRNTLMQQQSLNSLYCIRQCAPSLCYSGTVCFAEIVTIFVFRTKPMSTFSRKSFTASENSSVPSGSVVRYNSLMTELSTGVVFMTSVRHEAQDVMP